jgi:hypothetical protein
VKLDYLDERTTFGAIGFSAALLGFACIAVTLLLVFGPARGSRLDQFVIEHRSWFRGTLWAVFFGSIVTFLRALFGNGWQRGFGAALSIVNFLLSLSILGAGE